MIKFNLIYYNRHVNTHYIKFCAHLRYFLGGYRPSKTSILKTY